MNLSSDQISDDLETLYTDFAEPATWQQSPLADAPLNVIVQEGPINRVPVARGPKPLHDIAFTLRTRELPAGYDLQTGRIDYVGETYRVQDQQGEGHEITLFCQRL